MKGQNFASQVLSRHTFRISRKKGSDFFDHRGTLRKNVKQRDPHLFTFLMEEKDDSVDHPKIRFLHILTLRPIYRRAG